jgi:hypothetical protein
MGLCVVLFLAACGGGTGESFVPKPKAYPRMDLPIKSYQPFSAADFPMDLQMPA